MRRKTLSEHLVRVIALFMLTMTLLFSVSAVCFAEPTSLNEIGLEQSQEQKTEQSQGQKQPEKQEKNETEKSDTFKIDDSNVSDSNRESAKAVGEIFKQGSLTQESVEKSKKWVEPVAKVVNLLIATLVSLLAVGIVCVSVLDLIYIQLPFARGYMAPQQTTPSTSMPSNMPGAMPGNMAPTAPVQSSSTTRQWVSDEAIAALQESQPQQTVGMGPQLQQQQGKPGGKNALIAYAKKRSFALIMLGICIVVFTCTALTDLGLLIGVKLIGVLSGIK